MGDLASIVEIAKTKLSQLITKPKMSEKLLSKPPFRFLHDTISSVTTTTGFGEGLFSEGELDSNAITDKQAKINYLEKIFNLVGICKGTAIDIRAAKVVSGLEPENTNTFLISLAECASNPGYDNAAAVRMCLSGVLPGASPPPLKNSGFPIAESKSSAPDPIPAASNSGAKSQPSNPKDDAKSAPTASGTGGSSSRRGGGEKEVESKAAAELEVVAPERGKSRGGTRGGKPNQATALDAGLGGSGMNSAMTVNLDSQIEKCDGTEATTQALLSEIIQRPKLTDKLLSKPPFRYLHDIITEVVRVTGFAKNLYTDLEMDSANVNEKNQKMDFLEKIIKVVGLQLNTLVAANPAKIVAGRDAQDTNNFLQLLAVAARHMPDSHNSVRIVMEQYGGMTAGGGGGKGGNPPSEQPSMPAQKQQIATTATPTQQPISSAVPSAETKAKGHDSKESSREQSSREQPPMTSREQPPMTSKETPRDPPSSMNDQMIADEKITYTENEDVEDADTEKRSTRPTTARRRPPKVKDGAKEVQAKDIAPAVAKKTTGIIIDGQNDDDDDDIPFVPEESRLVDQLGNSESKTVVSNDNNNPQSKLVKDIMSRQVEQEAIARGGAKTNESVDETKSSSTEVKDGSSGVGIRLGRLRKTGLDGKGGSSSGGASSGGSNSSYHETDLEKLRKSIQLLVQHTGPLGTCMDFIQEDISLMTTELHRWEEECRRYELEYEEAKRKTKEILHPLKLQLAEASDQVNEAVSKVASAKAANFKLDDAIQQILKLSSTA